MKTKISVCVLIPYLVVFVGCASYQQTIRDVSQSLGGIGTRDIQQADAYRKELPEYLALPQQQVRVEPGSGVTHVTILGMNSEAERARISDAIATLKARKQGVDPIDLRFQ